MDDDGNRRISLVLTNCFITSLRFCQQQPANQRRSSNTATPPNNHHEAITKHTQRSLSSANCPTDVGVRSPVVSKATNILHHVVVSRIITMCTRYELFLLVQRSPSLQHQRQPRSHCHRDVTLLLGTSTTSILR